MATNLPTHFIDEVRLEIFDSTAYTDNEITEFARRAIQKTSPSLQMDVDISTNPSSVWSYTVSGVDNTHAWEVFKYATIALLTDDYYKGMITSGVGVSIGLGAERIDTKSLLLTMKGEMKAANKLLNEKILAYNLIHKQGVAVDLYYDDPST